MMTKEQRDKMIADMGPMSESVGEPILEVDGRYYKAGQVRKLLEAAHAVVKYDESILGRAARGEVDLTVEGKLAIVEGQDLDQLYLDMVKCARAALR